MAVWDKYGFSKNDPNYWVRTTRAILDDTSIPDDQQFKIVAEFVQAYQAEKRDHTARDKARSGFRGNLDPDNAVIKEAEEKAKSIQNPNFKKKQA